MSGQGTLVSLAGHFLDTVIPVPAMGVAPEQPDSMIGTDEENTHG
jgi:hypothetical protein